MTKLAAPWLVASFLAHLAGAQAPTAPGPIANASVTADLCGTVADVAPGRVRVTVWHDDRNKHAVEPIAEGFAAADGTFAFDSVPWFRGHSWG
ncbi:MAG: hypothetical protein ACK5UQ_01740, partial [Planctomycetota bacterium]